MGADRDLRPPDALESPRFAGIRTFMRLPHRPAAAGADVVVLGIPFDTGATFRVGARFGPVAIRAASVLLKPYSVEQGVDVFAACSAVDLGDVDVVPGYLDDSYARIREAVAAVVAAGAVPLALGGDHSITLPELRALAGHWGPLALVQFDAHTDTWDSYFGRKYTHGTVVRRAVEEGLILPQRSTQVGIRGPLYRADDVEEARRLGLEVIPMTTVRRQGAEAVAEAIRRRTADAPAFLSFDVDFLDPAFAPGTGTPQVGGATSAEALQILQGCAGLTMAGADVVEVVPAYDVGEITALLAAQVVFEYLALVGRQRVGG
ncbi:MAG: agmatinase [Armatimonadota bacterium]|nr:agmatinase [Armatimonadota bacterium]MDR7448561.1 agmatinase [Armatimonadota bacterium]MDR7458926.1 agmatinase [Armatimonadota bacterium]MDR7478927.1 agmatinase [Armatimonadota bacterium]MDR7488325.1 agmatinase [Armatimonadota bacterium]